MARFQQKRLCVYSFCSALVDIVMIPQMPGLPAHDEAKRMQVAHDIEHPIFTGPCPGSNMYVGFTPFDPTPPETVAALDERYQVDARRLPALIQQEDDREIPPASGPSSSQSLRNPRRMGREPEPTSEDWALGGREDEDSGHAQQYAHNPPVMKPGIYGERQGNFVASVHELLVMANTGSLKNGEAHSSCQNALNEIEAAIGALNEEQNIISGLQGQSESGTLREWMYLVLEAKNSLLETQIRLQEAMENLTGSEEKADRFKSNLLA